MEIKHKLYINYFLISSHHKEATFPNVIINPHDLYNIVSNVENNAHTQLTSITFRKKRE